MRKIRNENSKGFTLIEMLVVIAIIAVLVAIIIPTVQRATKNAEAATDAANLRSVLGQANVILINGTPTEGAFAAASLEVGECKSYPGAHMELMYVNPGFIRIYYVYDGNYYSLDYFANIADGGEEEISTERPDYAGAKWFDLTEISG